VVKLLLIFLPGTVSTADGGHHRPCARFHHSDREREGQGGRERERARERERERKRERERGRERG
jgi:hypothetical protein